MVDVPRPERGPGDIVVLDNLKPHLAPGVAESIEGTWAWVLLLPPCSSDSNPIGGLWSHFEGRRRRAAARTGEGLFKAVGDASADVTRRQIVGWFNHSGLYATRS